MSPGAAGLVNGVGRFLIFRKTLEPLPRHVALRQHPVQGDEDSPGVAHCCSGGVEPESDVAFVRDGSAELVP